MARTYGITSNKIDTKTNRDNADTQEDQESNAWDNLIIHTPWQQQDGTPIQQIHRHDIWRSHQGGVALVRATSLDSIAALRCRGAMAIITDERGAHNPNATQVTLMLGPKGENPSPPRYGCTREGKRRP